MTTSANKGLWSKEELVGILAGALGTTKAEEAIRDAIAVTNLRRPIFNQHEALQLFEHIATAPGLVGVSARFAKTRIHFGKRA